MRRKILVVLLVLVLAFIWVQSCMSVSASREESRGVMDLITPLLEFFVGRGNVTLLLVRKLAHFCEFFVLGCILSLLLPLRPAMRLLAAGFALLAGFIDETIQIFSGRGDQISDVWLDLSGAAVGILLTTLLLLLLRRKRPQRDSPALK